MAISTFKTFLMKKDSSSYKKLVDIKSTPDLGGTPEALDTTTLSDRARTYIPGIDEVEALEFTANYTKTDYTTLKGLEGTETEYAVYFGGSVDATSGVVTATGDQGKFTFKGYLNVYVNGGGVNEVVDMTISIMPSTVIAFAAS